MTLVALKKRQADHAAIEFLRVKEHPLAAPVNELFGQQIAVADPFPKGVRRPEAPVSGGLRVGFAPWRPSFLYHSA